jgi:hypothetical protein
MERSIARAGRPEIFLIPERARVGNGLPGVTRDDTRHVMFERREELERSYAAWQGHVIL